MELAGIEGSVPFQSIEFLARLSETAIRDSLTVPTGNSLGHAKTRVVTLRSRLVRSRKLFEAGLLREEDYFAEVGLAERELLSLLGEVGAEPSSPAGLRQKIASLLRETRAARANVVFISYRRDDSAYIVDRVDQHLRSRFGTESIFRDFRSIDYGNEFAQKIEDVLSRTRVCLVIIGRRWCGQMSNGQPRINQLDDWVRREVRSALDRRITVVPVLTEGVRLEELCDLPDSIAGIRVKQALTLRPDPDFAIDMERLTSFVARRIM
jgi:hypothetical protein